MKHELESRFGGEITASRYADDTTLMANSEEELKSLLRRMKEKSEKAGLKFNIQKMKIAVAAVDSTGVQAGVTLAADHLVAEDHGIQCYHFMANRWEKMETVTDFIFLGSKMTADGDCSHEIKRCLLLGRKAMTNLDSVLKSRDITLPKRSI